MTRLIILFAAILNALLPAPATATAKEVFLGTWGTKQQCAQLPIIPNGTVLAQPYEITTDWLKQGQLWCALNWGPVAKRKDGIFTAAHALCGEDSLQTHFLTLKRSNQKLSMQWNFSFEKQELQQCAHN